MDNKDIMRELGVVESCISHIDHKCRRTFRSVGKRISAIEKRQDRQGIIVWFLLCVEINRFVAKLRDGVTVTKVEEENEAG